MSFAHLPAIGSLGFLFLGLAFFGLTTSFIYLCLVIFAAGRYKHNSRAGARSVRQIETSTWPPVTVLKPVHGMEPELEKNLESFFRQDYPNFEVILIDRCGHIDHLAGGTLFFFVIRIEFVGNMAELTIPVQ